MVALLDSSIARKTTKMTFDIFQNQKYILIDISYRIGILYIKTFDCQKNRKSAFLEIPENCWMVSEKWSKYIFVILESKSEIDLKITEGSKFQEARFWFSNPTWKRWLSYSPIHWACSDVTWSLSQFAIYFILWLYSAVFQEDRRKASENSIRYFSACGRSEHL